MKPRVLISTLVACLLLTNNIQAQTHPHPTRNRLPDGSPEAMMTEVIVRPLSLAGTVLGGAIHVITWPFAVLGGQDTTESRRQLINKPLEATFKRPLGDFTQLYEMNRGKHQPVDRSTKTALPIVVLGQPSAPTPTPAQVETPTLPTVKPEEKKPAEPKEEEPENTAPVKPSTHEEKPDEQKKPGEIKPNEETIEPKKEIPAPLEPPTNPENPDGEKKPAEVKPSEENPEPKKETPAPVEPKVYQSPSGKAYPTHWGAPPLRQTRDLRPLPGGYGNGSGTLARWIQENLDKDAQPKTEDPDGEKKPIEIKPNEEIPAPVDPPNNLENPDGEKKPAEIKPSEKTPSPTEPKEEKKPTQD